MIKSPSDSRRHQHQAAVDTAFASRGTAWTRVWRQSLGVMRTATDRMFNLVANALVAALAVIRIRLEDRPRPRKLVSRIIARLSMRRSITEGLDERALAKALESDVTVVLVLAGMKALNDDTAEALSSVSRLPAPLRVEGSLWLVAQPQLLEELPRILYEGLVLTGLPGLGNPLADIHLSLVHKVSARFSDDQVKAIADRLWVLSETKADPYNRVSHKTAASNALIRLVSARPVAESTVVEKLLELPPGRRAPTLEILGRSIRHQESNGPARFLSQAKKCDLGKEEIRVLAAAANRNGRISPLRSIPVKPPSSVRSGTAWSVVATIILATHPAATAAMIALLSHAIPDFPWRVAPSVITTEIAVAIVALIATINVFTVQLSTTRLPGTIARVSGQPAALIGAYAAAVTLLFITLLEPGRFYAVRDSILLVLLALTLGWLLLSLVRIFSRTDAARASQAYLRRGMPRWTRAGRRFGRLQKRSAHLLRAIESLSNARVAPGVEVIGHDVVDYRVASRGLFLPPRRLLRRALSHEAFTTGAHLHFTTGFGQVVSDGTRVAALNPGSTPVGRPLTRRLTRALTNPVASNALEAVSTEVITLASFALNSAEQGDARLAHAIAGHAGEIVSAHLASIRSARAGRDRDSYDAAGPDRDRVDFPVTPVLRDVADFLANHAGDSPSAGRTTDVLIERCLDACVPDDHFAAILIGAIDSSRAQSIGAERIGEWLLLVGLTALRRGQAFEYEMVVNRLVTLLGEGGEEAPRRGLTALCCAAASLRPELFPITWNAIIGSQSSPQRDGDMRAVMQIGAVALRVGYFSAALEAADWFTSPQHNAWMRPRVAYENIFEEALRAQIGHIDLGTVPTDSLEHFRDLVDLL